MLSAQFLALVSRSQNKILNSNKTEKGERVKTNVTSLWGNTILSLPHAMYAAECPHLEAYFIAMLRYMKRIVKLCLSLWKGQTPLACLINFINAWLCARFSSRHKCNCRCDADLHTGAKAASAEELCTLFVWKRGKKDRAEDIVPNELEKWFMGRQQESSLLLLLVKLKH